MDISYEIIRSPRKSLSLQITPAGDIIVRCPRRYPVREIEKFVESKRDWIEKRLTKIESRPLRNGNFEYAFYLDFEGNAQNENTVALLCALSEELPQFTLLGNYHEQTVT